MFDDSTSRLSETCAWSCGHLEMAYGSCLYSHHQILINLLSSKKPCGCDGVYQGAETILPLHYPQMFLLSFTHRSLPFHAAYCLCYIFPECVFLLAKFRLSSLRLLRSFFSCSLTCRRSVITASAVQDFLTCILSFITELCISQHFFSAADWSALA